MAFVNDSTKSHWLALRVIPEAASAVTGTWFTLADGLYGIGTQAVAAIATDKARRIRHCPAM
jgi:hypothetical protein